MSLDIWPTIYTGGPVMADLLPGLNITHNLRLQIVEAGVDPWDWEGRKLETTVEPLRTAVNLIHDEARAQHFRTFDAPNGWGTLNESREFLKELLALSEAHPMATWRVSR